MKRRLLSLPFLLFAGVYSNGAREHSNLSARGMINWSCEVFCRSITVTHLHIPSLINSTYLASVPCMNNRSIGGFHWR